MECMRKSIALILTLLICFSNSCSIFAAESAGDTADEYYPKITLGSKIKGEGLAIRTDYTPVVKGGREGLMSGVQVGGGRPEYILVDIDDNWAYNLPIYTGIEVIVEYFDDLEGKFNLTYNTHKPDVGKYTTPNTEWGGNSLVVELGGTMEWKTHTFYLEDAKFANKIGCDFRLGIWWPTAKNNYGAITIGSIAVKKVPIRTPLLYDGLTSHEIGNIFSIDDEIKISHNFTNKLNEAVTTTVKTEVFDSNNALVAENTQNVEFGKSEVKSVDVSIDNPGKYGIYRVVATEQSYINSKPENVTTHIHEQEFSVSMKVSDEDGNSRFGYAQHLLRGYGSPDYSPDLIQQVGGTWVREDFLKWQEVEKTQGVYEIPAGEKEKLQKIKDSGLNILGIFMGRVAFYDGGKNPHTDEGIAAFAKYCAFLAKELRGIVDHWEMWNEWNIQAFNPSLESPETYAKLVKAVYTEVKKVNPDAFLIGCDSAGMADEKINPSVYTWTKRVFDAGGYDYMDAVSGHHYDWGKDGFDEQKYITLTKSVQELMKQYGEPKPLWVTEIGTSTYNEGTPKDEQPGVLALMYAMTVGYDLCDKMMFYCFYDRADDSYVEASWGVLNCWQRGYTNFPEANRTANSAKPGYLGMGAMSNFVGATADFEKILEKDSAYALKFHNNTLGKDVMMALSGMNGEKILNYNLGCKNVIMYDVYGNEMGRLASDTGIYTINLQQNPVYLVGDFTAFELADESLTMVKSDATEKGTVAGDVVEFVYTKNVDKNLHIKLDIPSSLSLNEEPVFVNNTAKISLKVVKNAEKIKFNATVLDDDGNVVYTQKHVIILTAPVEMYVKTGQVAKNSIHWRAEITVKSLCNTSSISGSVNVTEPTEIAEIARERQFELAPREETTFYYTIPETAVQKVMDMTSVLKLDSGYEKIETSKLDFTAASYTENPPVIDGVISPGEWNSVWIGAEDARDVKQIADWADANDLSFNGTMHWDEKNFYLAGIVRDNIHSVSYSPQNAQNLWRGDSIQFGVDDHETVNAMDTVLFTEVGIANVPGEGDVAFRYKTAYESPINTKIENAQLVVKRYDTYTVYELAIPWDELFYENYVPDPAGTYRFSVLVNDNDGQGRRGWIEYCSGIGTNKNVELFGAMKLTK